MTEEEKEQYDKHLEKLIKSLRLSWIPITVGILLVAVLGWNFEDLGPFGDFLAGSTVPLFTLVSSIGVILTLRMQQRQLEMQSQELQNSIVEMQETRKVMMEQGETMALQRFESTFFNMVSLHNEIVKSLSATEYSRDRMGMGDKLRTDREVFPLMLKLLKKKHDNLIINHNITNQPAITQIRLTYEDIFKEHEAQLGHYFRNLYRIVKFVDEAKIDDKEKRNYIGIIKAQLSSYELAVLLYNGLSEYGVKFLPLMRKYNLMDNLNKDLLEITIKDFELYETYSEPVEDKDVVQA
jgi:Putative phage abortive infection protein